MKNFVAVLCTVLISFIFCSCSADTSGYITELTECDWIAENKGGARAELCFEGEKATLTLESGDLKKEISGKYVADEKSFIIFVPELSYNYKFDYTPSCSTLEVTYNNMTIDFKKK